MKKIITLILTLAILNISTNSAEIITVKGSDTMVILAQRWAENYMAKFPDVTIQVTGGGSGTGISALINGTTDICNASRPMKKTEREKLKEKYNSFGIEIKTAVDALSVYVNETNKIKELSLAQLKDIYQGKITNWKEVAPNTDDKKKEDEKAKEKEMVKEVE